MVMANVQSVARLPRNAFGDFRDVPSNQDYTYTKTFKFSKRGIKIAAKHLHHKWREYAESHGRCAVCGGHLMIDGRKFAPTVADHVADLMRDDSVDAWRAACAQYNQIQAESDAAFEAEMRRLEGLDR